jgi:dihydroorotate dehydrogenase (fumarate)
MNASGVMDTTREELESLAQSDAGAIVVKSATILPREGNALPRTAEIDGGMLQSIGLANLGYRAYAEMLPWLKSFGKPVVQSIAGFTAGEYATMAEAFADADLIEVNLGCPNVGHAVGGFDPAYAREVAQRVLDVNPKAVFKLPPYLDAPLQERVLDSLSSAGAQALTLINSPGNCSALTASGPRIAPVWGGLCGPALKPLAIGNILRAAKHGGFDIIGVGGITTRADVEEFKRAGATAFQLGYSLMTRGPGVFREFLQ